MSITVSAQYQS